MAAELFRLTKYIPVSVAMLVHCDMAPVKMQRPSTDTTFANKFLPADGVMLIEPLEALIDAMSAAQSGDDVPAEVARRKIQSVPEPRSMAVTLDSSLVSRVMFSSVPVAIYFSV